VSKTAAKTVFLSGFSMRFGQKKRVICTHFFAVTYTMDGREAMKISSRMDEQILLLERGPAVFASLLGGLPEAMEQANEGEGTWTLREVAAHVLHAERTNWIVRVRELLANGPEHTFAPFARVSEPEGSMSELLDAFAAERAKNLAALRGLGLREADWERQARHPAFGTVTLAQLVTTWAAHDLTHVHQVSRILAGRYREAVGPWVQYLGVMRCAGHGG